VQTVASDGIRVHNEIVIPLSEIRLSYVCAGGPGGQNVNKVASKAVLRFNLRGSPSLPDPARRRALARLASRLTNAGELVLASGTYRDQPRNREAVLERLRALLAAAVRVPRPRKRTRPPRAAKERRLAIKRARSEIKRARRIPLD
jgi:ribosome-associated protein